MKDILPLNITDKKILSLIEYNPRITLSELGVICHLSKDTIRNRISKLENKKIILRYTTFIDYKKLGNESYKIYLKISATKKQKEELKVFLRKQKNVFSFFESNGSWNISIAVFAKTFLEYNKIENTILEKFGDIISSVRFCSMIDAEIMQKDFLDQKSPLKNYRLWGETNNYLLDGIDKKLIRSMHENSRISLVGLSEETELGLDAIKNRIKKLNNNKIIPIYKTILNYEKLGFEHYKILIFPKNYSEESEKKLINFLRKNKSCINFIRTVGPWKMEAEFWVRRASEMEEIEDELYENFEGEIKDLEVSILRNEELFACKELLLE